MNGIDANEAAASGKARWTGRLEGTLINPETLLATDYLNHFNEVIMLINMIADLPDMVDDIRQWRFKTYQEHFRQTNLSYGALAAQAYEDVPADLKQAFELVVEQLVQVITATTKRIEEEIAANQMEELRRTAAAAVTLMVTLVDVAGAIIAGTYKRIPQEQVDKFFATEM